jgi:hypothetical protein
MEHWPIRSHVEFLTQLLRAPQPQTQTWAWGGVWGGYVPPPDGFATLRSEIWGGYTYKGTPCDCYPKSKFLKFTLDRMRFFGQQALDRIGKKKFCTPPRRFYVPTSGLNPVRGLFHKRNVSVKCKCKTHGLAVAMVTGCRWAPERLLAWQRSIRAFYTYILRLHFFYE